MLKRVRSSMEMVRTDGVRVSSSNSGIMVSWEEREGSAGRDSSGKALEEAGGAAGAMCDNCGERFKVGFQLSEEGERSGTNKKS